MAGFRLPAEEAQRVLEYYGEPCDRLVREKERKRITSISRGTAYNLELQGKYPARKVLGTRSCAWQLSELLYWINTQPTNQEAA